MKLFDLFEKQYYDGEPLEKGGTSIASKGDIRAAPAIRSLYGDLINDGDTVLDYGAGKYYRNADYLRDKGLEVFAYDPFNFTNETDGWDAGDVAKRVPKGKKFDVAFTCYVLNVVPFHVEQEIIRDIERKAKRVLHIVRNQDVYDLAKNGLLSQNKTIWAFFLEHFWTKKEPPKPEQVTDKLIERFCKFGFETSRGFQRIPKLEEHGYKLIQKTHGFKVYSKGTNEAKKLS